MQGPEFNPQYSSGGLSQLTWKVSSAVFISAYIPAKWPNQVCLSDSFNIICLERTIEYPSIYVLIASSCRLCVLRVEEQKFEGMLIGYQLESCSSRNILSMFLQWAGDSEYCLCILVSLLCQPDSLN